MSNVTIAHLGRDLTIHAASKRELLAKSRRQGGEQLS
jgi:hypothetical protein